MRSSCAQGACKLRSRRLQRQSICLREGSMLPYLVLWPCSGLSASPSASQAASCLSREATTLTKLAKRGTATDFQPAMPVRPLPRPARRARAVSAAIGRFDHPPLHRGALETAPAAAAAAPDAAMATDASDATVSLPAPPAPPAGKPRARGRSDDPGPSSSVDSMDHDDDHRGGVSEEAPKKRRSSIACDAPPGAAQVARARAAALPPDACTDAHVHARTPAQLAANCAVGQAAAAASAAPNEHSTSAAQQPTAQVLPLSARRCARPAHAHAHARPAFDPATAAARP